MEGYPTATFNATPTAPASDNPVCGDFQRGQCSRPSCRFRHECKTCGRKGHGAHEYEKPLRRNSASFIGPKIRHESQIVFFGKRVIATWRSGNPVRFAGFAKVAVTNQQESMKKAYGHRAPKGGAQNITSYGTSYGTRVESACVCVEFV